MVIINQTGCQNEHYNLTLLFFFIHWTEKGQIKSEQGDCCYSQS